VLNILSALAVLFAECMFLGFNYKSLGELVVFFFNALLLLAGCRTWNLKLYMVCLDLYAVDFHNGNCSNVSVLSSQYSELRGQHVGASSVNSFVTCEDNGSRLSLRFHA